MLTIRTPTDRIRHLCFPNKYTPTSSIAICGSKLHGAYVVNPEKLGFPSYLSHICPQCVEQEKILPLLEKHDRVMPDCDDPYCEFH